MPAVLSHYFFARRVLGRLQKTHLPEGDVHAALIGAQGPDIFYFHRALPWQPGRGHAGQGLALHDIHPAPLFDCFRKKIEPVAGPDREVMLGFMAGFLCHYVLDRDVHPYVLYWQTRLREEQPRYDRHANRYHFRVESALDSLTLAREAGRTVRDFPLASVLPAPDKERDLVIGKLYEAAFRLLPARLIPAKSDPAYIAKAVADMREVMGWMSDGREMKQYLLLRPVEIALHQGHFGSSLMRRSDVSDYDYANTAHKEWQNGEELSTESYFDLFDKSVTEAVRLYGLFIDALDHHKSVAGFIGERDFSGKKLIIEN